MNYSKISTAIPFVVNPENRKSYIPSTVVRCNICGAFAVKEKDLIALSTACTQNMTVGTVSDCTNARTPASDQIYGHRPLPSAPFPQ